jgi:riboflavin biosynthesis pyrimidine reductase
MTALAAPERALQHTAAPMPADVAGRTALPPLETLYDPGQGDGLPLPAALAGLYGPLRLPTPAGRPIVLGNFVTTLDGVVSLGVPGQAGGGPISGFNPHDRMVMGLLRAAADAVIVGAGTLRAAPHHVWTPDYVYPPLAAAYAGLRTALGKPTPPLNVIVTASGDLDLDLRVFQSGEAPVLVVTTGRGAARLATQRLPPTVQVAAVPGTGAASPQAILRAVAQVRPATAILVEGGPRLIGDFFAAQGLDVLFLTLAPQVAGRDRAAERPGLVAGQIFAPDHPVWSTLAGVKRAGSHLFLRYEFATESGRPADPLPGGRL